MQCPNCQFENMPGIDQCGRCSGSLRLKSATIDINPPRARDRGARRRHGQWAARRWMTRLQTLASPLVRLWDEVFATTNVADLMNVNWLTIWVPGLPQWLSGKRLLARVLFGSYAASLLLGLLLWGSPPGAVLLGIAFACHAATIMDVVFSLDSSSAARIAGSLMGISTLTVAALLLNSAVSRWVIDVRVMTISNQPLAPGDSILLHPYRSAPRSSRGDIVLWNMAQIRINDETNHRVTLIQGEQIDRVLAVDGDVVEFGAGQLLVNGQPPEYLPLSPRILESVPAATITVPPNSCIVLASTNPNMPLAWGHDFASVAVVPNGLVRAKVLFRNYPLTRWGRIR